MKPSGDEECPSATYSLIENRRLGNLRTRLIEKPQLKNEFQ